mmetsp:Transcript_11649/g.17660  ORF Transcript_11649/g.17660 Transcript_11649/m.17660 type:complete len:130 (+) Transcript_11649:105-494(+)|eukprot:CAMPEP_0185032152 /NCGR_PEP_ID=MMETSP1103-20130426/20055_1 /TAXON_ID=36769 /ORGANISM="Paraphysomonas bandaiensis, Strain Caron Lab Isolate" /LENGTH=129 /DNA_ID=CAMNT_0027567945 /DNA_START=45 /DNA_END=434 /DNA_ORIENTATION=+
MAHMNSLNNGDLPTNNAPDDTWKSPNITEEEDDERSEDNSEDDDSGVYGLFCPFSSMTYLFAETQFRIERSKRNVVVLQALIKATKAEFDMARVLDDHTAMMSNYHEHKQYREELKDLHQKYSDATRNT